MKSHPLHDRGELWQMMITIPSRCKMAVPLSSLVAQKASGYPARPTEE
jgi:hypothetical protein